VTTSSLSGRWKRAVARWMGESPATRDPRLLWHQLRVRGLRGLFPAASYGREFFAEHEPLRPSYEALGDLLIDWAHPRSACDLGCGNGYLLAALEKRGVSVAGAEGSAAALPWIDPAIRDRVRVLDLTEPQDLGRHDLAISSEVAEHLPKRASARFVANVARASSRHVFFTAAQPGQWGDGHINCQPKEFWISLFRAEGFTLDEAATVRFSERVRQNARLAEELPWIADNLLLFERG
jgi:SAM-dependent methyltransferase